MTTDFDQFVVSHGFVKSEYDHYVYIKKLTNGSHIYLLLYVDDMLVASKDATQIMKVKQLLSSRFEMRTWVQQDEFWEWILR